MSEIKIDKVVSIIRSSGGKIIGRTRLQKIAYLLAATGIDSNFNFSYKHYGPFSEQLASSAKFGVLLGDISETIDQTNWGANYSTYTINERSNENTPACQLANIATSADSIELELAATALFLFHDGYENAWDETARRKPEKSTRNRIQNAKTLLTTLSKIELPIPIPDKLLS